MNCVSQMKAADIETRMGMGERSENSGDYGIPYTYEYSNIPNFSASGHSLQQSTDFLNHSESRNSIWHTAPTAAYAPIYNGINVLSAHSTRGNTANHGSHYSSRGASPTESFGSSSLMKHCLTIKVVNKIAGGDKNRAVVYNVQPGYIQPTASEVEAYRGFAYFENHNRFIKCVDDHLVQRDDVNKLAEGDCDSGDLTTGGIGRGNEEFFNGYLNLLISSGLVSKLGKSSNSQCTTACGTQERIFSDLDPSFRSDNFLTQPGYNGRCDNVASNKELCASARYPRVASEQNSVNWGANSQGSGGAENGSTMESWVVSIDSPKEGVPVKRGNACTKNNKRNRQRRLNRNARGYDSGGSTPHSYVLDVKSECSIPNGSSHVNSGINMGGKVSGDLKEVDTQNVRGCYASSAGGVSSDKSVGYPSNISGSAMSSYGSGYSSQYRISCNSTSRRGNSSTFTPHYSRVMGQDESSSSLISNNPSGMGVMGVSAKTIGRKSVGAVSSMGSTNKSGGRNNGKSRVVEKDRLETAAYDPSGNRVAGVWYDTTRRLWRVMYLEGDKRKTKGFSPRDYGYFQARDMAVALKYEKMRRIESTSG